MLEALQTLAYIVDLQSLQEELKEWNLLTIHEQKNILSIPELEYYNQDFRSTLIFSPTYWFSHEKSIPKRLHLVVRYPVGADGLEVVKYLMDYRGCTVGCGAFQDTTRGEAFHAMQLLVDSMAGKSTYR